MASCASDNKQDTPQIPSADTIKELKYYHALTVDRLHRFKIGKADTVENSMEADLANEAHFLYLIAKESKGITTEERKSIYQQLILLSVMNEKFEIKQWQQNEKLQKIFTDVQSIDQEFTEVG